MWLLEKPLPTLAVGIVAVAILVCVLVQTGKRWALVAIAGVVLLTAGLLLLEQMVVTEVEEVERTLYDLAAELCVGDVERVIPYVSEQSPELRREARHKLPMVDIQKATIKRNLKIIVSRARGIPVAKATFNAVLVASAKNGVVTNQTYPRFFILNLRKENGRWRISQYEDQDPFRRESP